MVCPLTIDWKRIVFVLAARSPRIGVIWTFGIDRSVYADRVGGGLEIWGFGCQWFGNLGFGCQDECDSSLPVWNAVRVGGAWEIWASAARTNAIRPYGMWGNVNVGGIAVVNGRSIPDPVGTNRVRPGRAKPTNLGNLNIRNKPIEFTTIHLGRTKPKNRKNLSAIDPIAGSLKSPHGKGLGLLGGGLKLCRQCRNLIELLLQFGL
jgi:hypothetical protein